MDELHLSDHEWLRVVRSDADVVEVEATYEAHGAKPPTHLHPSQDEHFHVLSGTVHAEVDGDGRELAAGDELTIRRGQVHSMWNRSDEPAVIQWRTTPALSTEAWFRGVDALHADAATHGRSRPDLFRFAALARRHRGTFRLVLGGSEWAGGAVVGVLSVLGRMTGRGKVPALGEAAITPR